MPDKKIASLAATTRGRPVPVELAQIQHGPIERRRTFTGILEPQAELVVAPKIPGRIEQLFVDSYTESLRGDRRLADRPECIERPFA